MDLIGRIVVAIFKLIALVVGALMLAGGGICAAGSLVFSASNPGMLTMVVIALVVAFIGWRLVKLVWDAQPDPQDEQLLDDQGKPKRSNDSDWLQ